MKNRFKYKKILRSLDPYIPWILTILFFSGWELSSRMAWISPLFFPPPSRIFMKLINLSISGELWVNLSSTVERLVLGFLLGAIPGILLGLSMGWSRRLGKIIDPIIAALHPIPKITIFPLILIIFGMGDFSRVVAIGLSAFFPALINSMSGVRQFSPIYFEVTRNFRASRWKTFTRVILPGSLPSVLSGIRLALNLSMVIAVTVELINATTGLGVMIFFAWQVLKIENLYAALFTTAILGIIINSGLHLISAKIAPWADSQQLE